MPEKLNGQSSINVLVQGWYFHGNVGDQLFIDAFKELFPDFTFKFVSQLTKQDLIETDGVILGGGSFLYKDLSISSDTLSLLKTKKIMYIGVGAETDISPMHRELMRIAKLVAIRSPEALLKVQAINPDTIVIPDIVYALQSQVVSSPKFNKSILIIPNAEVIPTHTDPHWKHTSFEYFKSEFAQFLDVLVEEGCKINFFTMCHNAAMSDTWASAAIVSMMKHRSTKYQLEYIDGDIKDLTTVMSQYKAVITQRYHGIILAEMIGTPYISIHHHDKLKFASPMHGASCSYYGLMKANLLQFWNELNSQSNQLIETDMFDTLKQKVKNIFSIGG